jgi:erythromycin esterase
MATGFPLPNRVNLRDIQMGDNLVWLLEHGFPGRRIIVWGATIHGARELPEIDHRDADVSFEKYTSMGQEIWNRIGPDYYAVGFTAASGEAGLPWRDAFQLDPPAKGSIEELFQDAGFENAFLDLRHIPAGGEWLHEPLLSRPFGYSYTIARWPRHLDGLVFTRVMERSRPRPLTNPVAAIDG